MHCHILPCLGGGPENLEQSMKLARQLHRLGFRRIVATPHIMDGFYNPSPEQVRTAVNQLQRTLLDEGISLFVDTAAQYYIDDGLVRLLDSRSEILPFGTYIDAPRSLILIETSLITFPDIWYDITDLLNARGLMPVLAHPERYIYLQNNRDWVRLLRNRGTLFKIDVASLTGRYGQGARQMAEWLIEQGHVSFIGTEMSNEQHLRVFREALASPFGQRLKRG
ncbi:MAG: capsular biosynthesis protein [Rudanella sp.]|nr:capsular biosynthesis protein [Rudanella sp.]